MSATGSLVVGSSATAASGGAAAAICAIPCAARPHRRYALTRCDIAAVTSSSAILIAAAAECASAMRSMAAQIWTQRSAYVPTGSTCGSWSARRAAAAYSARAWCRCPPVARKRACRRCSSARATGAVSSACFRALANTCPAREYLPNPPYSAATCEDVAMNASGILVRCIARRRLSASIFGTMYPSRPKSEASAFRRPLNRSMSSSSIGGGASTGGAAAAFFAAVGVSFRVVVDLAGARAFIGGALPRVAGVRLAAAGGAGKRKARLASRAARPSSARPGDDSGWWYVWSAAWIMMVA